MGRLPKKGIDYAGWSVSMFDDDTKIDKLLDAHGWQGFGIYFYLCQRAYGSEGYFYSWCYDDCATTARKMGGGIGAGTVKETVCYCLQIGLFDKRLFDRWSVISSRGIQKRYMEAIKNRDVKKVIADYWLLDKEDSIGLDFCTQNGEKIEPKTDFLKGNNDFLQGNADFLHQSKVKESKEKYSKVNENHLNDDVTDGLQYEEPYVYEEHLKRCPDCMKDYWAECLNESKKERGIEQ